MLVDVPSSTTFADIDVPSTPRSPNSLFAEAAAMADVTSLGLTGSFPVLLNVAVYSIMTLPCLNVTFVNPTNLSLLFPLKAALIAASTLFLSSICDGLFGSAKAGM